MFNKDIGFNASNQNNNLEKDEQFLDIQKIKADIDLILDKAYRNNIDVKDQGDIRRADVFIEDLQNIYVNHEAFKDTYNFNRAWSQEQVDKVVEIFNGYFDASGSSHNKLKVTMVLFNFFTTGKKDEREEFKGKTISDLFAKSLIDRLEEGKNISLDLQMAIATWAQNIHMVDRSILLDFLIAINSHPEVIDPGIRREITMGVGLFPSLIESLGKLAEDKNNISARLKALETIKILINISGNVGFGQAGVEARKILKKETQDTSNYFLNIRAEQIGEELDSPNRAKRLQLLEKYNKPEFATGDLQPLFLENNKVEDGYLAKKTLASSCYSKLSQEIGVIYNGHGEVDSYFNINNGQRLTLSDILKKEGFIENKADSENYKNQRDIYKTLIDLSFRNKIEQEFAVELSDFSVREQLQFINFISAKNVSEVNKVKDFILGGQTPVDKNNRFLSFLSLETDSDIGNKILEINEFLASQPEASNKLFAKHAELINQVNQSADGLVELYGDVFFGKTIDREKLIEISLKRTSRLLVVANENLKIASSKDKEKVIRELLKDLDIETKGRVANLEELKTIAEKLNEKYNNIGHDLLVAINSDEEGLEIFKDDWLEKAEDISLEMKTAIREDAKKHRKYDSERLKNMIENYQSVLEEVTYNVELEGEALENFKQNRQKYKSGEIECQDFLNKMENDNKIFYAPTEEEKVIYSGAIKKIQQILPLQIALEKKMDQIIYGREEMALPKGFSNFENDPVKPENIPDQAPLYFPVGISKDLPSWEAVLRGERKVVKPIDIYGYLFWLNNQERPINLIVCDEIQVNNYQIRYGQEEKESREKAIKIGNREALQYKKIIDTFGLDNIRLQGYSEFLMQNKDKYEYYKEVVTNLADRPDFKEIFLSMVQDSVSGAEQEKYINYALEELAWILSTNGTKIGHLNEARYDILGAVISNWEKLGREKGLDVFKDQTNSEGKILLNTVCKGLRDEINERKSKLDKNSSAAAYYQRLQEHLGKIKIDSKVGLDKKFKKDSLSLNFVCPEVGSASFGFRGDFEAKEGVVKFKEPYSTYFYKTDADLLTDSDQVVAAGEGSIGGKILTLDNKQQLKYANQVVRPILKHYFANLDRAPLKYFEKIGKNREELRQDSEEINSLLDAIRFIQKYIIRPTELV
ncbi:MAG: hypothetical protein WC249_02995 [Patescibacteria group bacterium]